MWPTSRPCRKVVDPGGRRVDLPEGRRVIELSVAPGIFSGSPDWTLLRLPIRRPFPRYYESSLLLPVSPQTPMEGYDLVAVWGGHLPVVYEPDRLVEQNRDRIVCMRL